MASPVTVIGLETPLFVIPPGLEVMVYSVMGDPPFDTGATNETDACAFPAVAVTSPGAPGATATTENVWLTCGAARTVPLPGWLALMVQVPVPVKVNVPPEVMVQTPGVNDVKTTVRPDVAVAINVGVEPKFWEPGFVNVMVCVLEGVTEFDAAEGAPVPVPFVAVTVNV